MNTRLPSLLGAFLVLGLAASVRGSALSEDAEMRALLQELPARMAAYHTNVQRESNLLRVVYFHPRDREPLTNWQERLERAVTDVSGFYREGMQRWGLACEGLPLERKDGKLVFHLVRGAQPAGEYNYAAGGKTAEEIRQALQVDFNREHVLVFYGLCRQEPDGRFVFDAPYYGSGSAQGGLAHVADCELLDPRLLTDTQRRIVYTEHAYPRMEQSVAKFNSMYLGGVAHELGHGLGLPHDAGSPAEQRQGGTSLMGGGNLTYREDKWGGSAPSYMSLATALRLASHPLVTGSNRERWTPMGRTLETLRFAANGQTLQVSGRVASKIEAYAVVAYLWHPRTWPGDPKMDHASTSYPARVKQGEFALELNGLPRGNSRLRLSTLHLNGAAADLDLHLKVNDSGEPDAAALNADWVTGLAEAAVVSGSSNARALVSDTALAQAPTPEARARLRVLRDIIEPPSLIDLTELTTNAAFVSDARWTTAKVGWGQVARNHYWFDERIRNGAFLSLGGQFYAKGLYAHSPSCYAFALGGKWKTFGARIGLRDGAHTQGSAVFTVRGDGRELYRSPVLRAGQQEEVKVDVAGVSQLELVTEGGEGHNYSSWAIWVEARVER